MRQPRSRAVAVRAALLCAFSMAAACRTMPRAQPASNESRDADLAHWPANASPAVIGRLVAGNVLARPLGWQVDPRRKAVIYPEAVSWYGALEVAELLPDADLRSRLISKFDVLRTPEGAAHISQAAHVDYRVFGAVPLEIYMLTRDTSYLSLGRSFADRQWENPGPDGITREARYWVDDMYMSTIVQVQAYRATGDTTYVDRSARMMVAYLDSLQQPNGLFYHAPDTPFDWGRGNGWFAAGMAEMLRSLPASNPDRARILAGYRRMMAALLKYQAPDGLWRQLVDRPESWVETSGSGMFTFAMVTGVKEGWLDAATYAPAARRAWLGLVRHLDASGSIDDVCVGTNKAAVVVGPDLGKQYAYYIARPRHSGDLHGEAPVLWTAAALLR